MVDHGVPGYSSLQDPGYMYIYIILYISTSIGVLLAADPCGTGGPEYPIQIVAGLGAIGSDVVLLHRGGFLKVSQSIIHTQHTL